MLALMFQIGTNRLALNVRDVLEVVPMVELRRVAGAATWLLGVFVHRGQVVPVVDLFALVGEGSCPSHLSSRIILVRLPGGTERQIVGLLAACVDDVRTIRNTNQATPRVDAEHRADLGPVYVAEDGILHLATVAGLVYPGIRQQLQIATEQSNA